MQQNTNAETIISLREFITTDGIPHHIVSDNGTQFVSTDFEEFTCTSEFKHY